MASLLVGARTSVQRRPRPSQWHRRWGGTAGVPRGPRLFLLPLSGWCAASAVTASGDTWLSPRGASVPAWCSSRLFVQRVVVEGRCGRLLFLSMLNLNIFTTLLSSSGCFAAALCFSGGCFAAVAALSVVVWAEALPPLSSGQKLLPPSPPLQQMLGCRLPSYWMDALPSYCR